MFFLAELCNATEPNIFIGVILMGDYEIDLDARIEQRLNAMNTNIVICENDCVQLFFL